MLFTSYGDHKGLQQLRRPLVSLHNYGKPSSAIQMTNVIGEANRGEVVPCFALSKNDSYVMSASGGKISLFNRITFKTMTTFMTPPPSATCLAFHPQDNNVIAIGMDDSTIRIYNVRVDEVKSKLKSHQKKVTGLAFSNALNVLVSSGADSQLCVWSTFGWEKLTSKFLQIPSERASNPEAHTRVQFHKDQTHLLAIHESQVAIFEAPNLENVKQWIPPQSVGAITDAIFSCNSQSIFICLKNGNLGVLVAATLTLTCLVNPASFLPSSDSSRVHPNVVAAHPTEAGQFAVGLTDGVYIYSSHWNPRANGVTLPHPRTAQGQASALQLHQINRRGNGRVGAECFRADGYVNMHRCKLVRSCCI